MPSLYSRGALAPLEREAKILPADGRSTNDLMVMRYSVFVLCT